MTATTVGLHGATGTQGRAIHRRLLAAGDHRRLRPPGPAAGPGPDRVRRHHGPRLGGPTVLGRLTAARWATQRSTERLTAARLGGPKAWSD
ncbi:hypothetical protein KZ829_22120 [Actinoplanes hulinensis]|uniref:NmrA-like domain-containing protein n=1 Tax=Actinoplanes hulinensis TaxID=1144547 RepID=A0ABS7B5V5_9ACTN|nr:hypothetical protein [Actinoplanes hulinensis]MBW6436441.1 hypothetical protein [Actinoplanes hulinensis]